MAKKVFHNIGLLISAILFIMALYVIHYKLKQYHFRDIFNQIQQTPWSSTGRGPHSGFAKLFMTHPHTEEHIKRLLEI